MCGIAGSISFDNNKKINKTVLTKMADAMAERGPDGSGVCVLNNERVGLGHRRLAIIDLSKQADQPMSNADDSIHIVFNGEIYNYQEIKEEINKIRNVKWKTDHSDTEVIIHAYEIWGIQCIKKFRGMFAFALWDEKKEKMWLVRDRLGIKPLYYGILRGKLNFASNVRALLEDWEQDKTVNKKAVYDFLSLLAVPAPNTLFKNIKKLPAGHYLEITLNGEIKTTCYWDICKYANMKKLKESEDRIKTGLLDKLKDSVKIRKAADVPVGVFLSGGIDSSTNLALFSEDSQEVNTFTAGYKGMRHYKNENSYAKSVADYCRAVHHDQMLDDTDVIEFVDTLKKLSDDPIADPVIVSQYYIAKQARENGIKVVQVGEGSDELFAGYTYWSKLARYEKLNVMIPQKIKKMIYTNIKKYHFNISEYQEELLRRSAEGGPVFWGFGTVYISEDRKRRLYKKKFLNEIGNHTTGDAFLESYRKCKKNMLRETVGWMGCVNMKFRLPEFLLMRTDWACMAVGVEGRVPFLDHELVEWGMRIPEHYKIKKGNHKHILKAAVKNVIPDRIINREKEGFGLPFMEWYQGQLGAVMKNSILHFVKASRYFEEKEVRRYIRDKNSEPITIWALFVLSLWWEQYIEPTLNEAEV